MSVEELYVAINDNDVQQAKKCLHDGNHIDTIVDGYTPLMWTIYYNRLEIFKLIIDRGANTNATAASDGRTPLMLCIERDYLEMARYLIEMDANTCKPDKDGITPLSLAVSKANIEMVSLLLDKGAKFTINGALFEAFRGGNDEITKFLIQNCTDINVKDQHGDTLFIKAVRKEKVSIVKLLVQRGADVNQKDKHGVSGLSIALSNSDFSTFQFLVESGADPHLATKDIHKMEHKNGEFAAYIKTLNLGSLNDPVNFKGMHHEGEDHKRIFPFLHFPKHHHH